MYNVHHAVLTLLKTYCGVGTRWDSISTVVELRLQPGDIGTQ